MQNRQAELNEAIKRTIVWFDIFSFPLTPLELWQFLPLKTQWSEIMPALTDNNFGLKQKQGFWFIGDEQKIHTRLRRQNYADRKFKLALKFAKIFGQLPWVKLIAVANQIGYGNLKDLGDIDLFIITQKNRLWLTRLIMAAPLKILKLRPNDRSGENNSRDTFCLSFLVDEDHLNLIRFRLNTGEEDIYLTYWLASLTPIFERGETFQKLISENAWLKKQLPNWQIAIPSHQRLIRKIDKSSISKLLDKLEIISANWQKKHLRREHSDLMNRDTRVIINDHTLKLHTIDRRQEFKDKFYEKLKTI